MSCEMSRVIPPGFITVNVKFLTVVVGVPMGTNPSDFHSCWGDRFDVQDIDMY